MAPAYAGACLVLLRGPPGNPGPSTDFSVTDGLRWNWSRIACYPPISQNGAVHLPRACASAGRHAAKR